MEYALWVLILGSVAVGVAGAVARTWSLHSRLYSLEDRVAVVEGNLNREVKARAGRERWQSPKKDDALLAALSAKPEPVKPWWEMIPSTMPRSYDGK